MEPRFGHLYQRDSSVSMLRVKMSRRRSQSQKENREREFSRHRRLDQIPECGPGVPTEGKREGLRRGNALAETRGKSVGTAADERKKMLTRYKEAKELQKEKEKRATEKKGGVFRVGLYKPQPLAPLRQVVASQGKEKLAQNVATAAVPSSRVTRSMKQNQNQTHKPVQPLTRRETAAKKVEATVRPLRSQASSKLQTAPPAGKDKAVPQRTAVLTQTARITRKPPAAPVGGSSGTAPDVKAGVQKTRAASKPVPPGGRTVQGKNRAGAGTVEQKKLAVVKEGPKTEGQSNSLASSTADAQSDGGAEEEEEETDTCPSFAPQGFVFCPPAGLSSLPPVLPPDSSRDDAPRTLVASAPPPAGSLVEPACPSPSPCLQSSGPQEPQHDVPYFRAAMASETDRLLGMCEQYEGRTDEPSIPEEMRDRMRTAVGQARLLMKERFGQFGGLVDDCALGRGEKVTTCSDLQGFWDMVYYQVEDVTRKFSALKEAELRGWQEELKPPPIRRKAVKKPDPTGKRVGACGSSAAAKSRLAAVKAAMKAKQAPGAAENPSPAQPQAEAPAAQTVLFCGGFFQVESPAKLPGLIRRSSRLSTVPSTHQAPFPSPKFTTPSRQHPLTFSHPSSVHMPGPQASVTKPACSEVTELQPSADSSSPLLTQCPPLPENGPPASQSERDAMPCGLPRVLFQCAPVQPGELVHLSPASHADPIQTDAVQVQTLTAESAVQGALAEQLEALVSPPADDPVPTPDSLALLSPESSVDPAQNLSLPDSACQLADSVPVQSHESLSNLSPCPSPTTPTQGSPLNTSTSSPGALGPSLSSLPSTPVCPPAPFTYHTPTVGVTDRLAVDADLYMCTPPELSCTDNVPSLDLECYIQSGPRSSQSPGTVAMETAASPATLMAMDVPRPEDQCKEGDSETHAEDFGVPLFTPEQRDRARQSVCETDIMMFTPP